VNRGTQRSECVYKGKLDRIPERPSGLPGYICSNNVGAKADLL